jgi:uncharacterized membrane protein
VIAGLLVLLVTIVSFGLLGGPMTVGFVMLVESRRRGEDVNATDVFDGFSHFGASLIAMLLIGFGVFVGSLLLVLPGLLFGLAMAFTFQAIAIDEAGATEAMGMSFTLIKENFGFAVVVLIIVLILSSIGAAVIFGSLLTMPFSLILMTLAYDRIRAR